MAGAAMLTANDAAAGGVAAQALSPRYRADIDGLRAVAILPVVLCHAEVRHFSGGYVGVDIFFVISGYLITSILVRDLASGRHSIAGFYRRRIVRIFPALFGTLIATSAVALLALMPGELVRYARSLVATVLFGSNFLFYHEVGYFDQAATSKPLLHTWSLAIEEQFYILWPFLLAWAGASRPARLRLLVTATILLSLALAILVVPRDMSAAFYLLPTRAWELAAGAFVAIVPLRLDRRRWLVEAAALAGLAMIAFAIHHYGGMTPFPGLAAIPPVLGAALLIETGRSGTLVSRLLACKPLVWIGWISYSLYLVHWPVIVFSRLWLLAPVTPAVQAAQVAAGIALGWLSWRFLEQPFRLGAPRWTTPRVIRAGVAGMAAFAAAAIPVFATGGFSARLTPPQRAVAAYLDLDGDALYRRGSCFIVSGDSGGFDARACLAITPGKPVVLIVGNSHAAHLWPGLSRYTHDLDILQATMAQCPPVLVRGREKKDCQSFYRHILTEWVPAHRPDVTLLSANWKPENLPDLAATLDDPRVRAGHVVLVGPVPRYSAALPRLLVLGEERGDPGLAGRQIEPGLFETDRRLAAMAASRGIPYLSPLRLLCPGHLCREWAAPGVPLQFDSGHLTAEGSQVVIDALMPELRSAAPALRLARKNGSTSAFTASAARGEATLARR